MSNNYHVVPYFNVISNKHEDEYKKSKRCRTENSFGPDFITTFLTEN